MIKNLSFSYLFRKYVVYACVSFCLLLMITITSRPALAVPTLPSQRCIVMGKTTEVAKQEKDTPAINTPSQHITFYMVSIKVSKSLQDPQDKGVYSPNNCSVYKSNEEIKTLYTIDQYAQKPITKNQTIRGTIQLSGDERSSGNYLSQVTIINDKSFFSIGYLLCRLPWFKSSYMCAPL